MRRMLMLLVLAMLTQAAVQAQGLQRVDLAVTAYNEDRAVIYDVRRMPLEKGMNSVSFSDVAALLDPTSVQLTSRGAPFEIVEQNFDYDVAGDAQLLYRYLGRNVTLNLEDGTAATGALLAGPQRVKALERARGTSKEAIRFSLSNVALTAEDRSIRVFPLRAVKDFSLDPGGGQVLTRPTLNWLVRSRNAAERDCEIAYMTGGMFWKADYKLVLPPDPAERIKADLTGVVTVRNNTGASYPDARLKLVAGGVNIVEEAEMAFERSRLAGDFAMGRAEKAAGPAFEERAMFEYHLYDLQRRTTMLDRETKQIEFLSAGDIPLDRFFVYDGALVGRHNQRNREYGTACDKSVWAYVEFKNSEENHVGMPLPKGNIRLMEAAKGGESFIGEASIDHTPRDEKVTLRVGRAFDLTGERVQREFKEQGQIVEERFEVTVRSTRAAPANLRVVEHVYRAAEWEVVQSTDEYRKADAQTIEFRFRLNPAGEKKIGYTVRYRFP